MSKLLIIVCLIVALTVSSAFRLLSRDIRFHCFIHLLVSRRHSFFQKLQTPPCLLNILTAIVCCDHTVSLRSRIVITALCAKTSLIPWLNAIASVNFLLVDVPMTWI